tara:strand:- start:522 stop:944 length:423 start_codon:yes stop_codon:yes gene_type:complete
MSLAQFMSSIAEEFSGREFTTNDLIEFVTGQSIVGAGVGLVDGELKKKKKKEKKAPKKTKMTIRQYMLTHDEYKSKVSQRVTENKQVNIDNCYSPDHEDYKSENFLKVLKEVMECMSEEELAIVQDKADKYNEEHFSDSE